VSRRRVLVLGGGIAGLTTAFELSRTPELREAWAVEVVEMGHRFGGRLASSHNPARWGRNQEHGLHVWFGLYDNTFRLAEDVWRDSPRAEGCPWSTVWDGLRPIFHSDHGLSDGEEMVIRRAFLPRMAGLPGIDDPGMLDALLAVVLDSPRALGATALSLLAGHEIADPSPRVRRARFRRLSDLVDQLGRETSGPATLAPRTRVEAGHRLERVLRRVHRPMARLALLLAGRDPGRVAVAQTLDLLLAMLRGLCSAEHKILEDGDLDRLSAWELSDWLSYHGLSERTRRDSRVLMALYDVPLAFRDGNPEAPVMEAGTAIRYALRLLLGYKHAPAYLLSAGAGETLVAPLCALLRRRGVRLTPFHRLERLVIDRSRRRVDAVELTRVARARGSYQPLIEREGFLSMRHEPDWDQLENGDELRQRDVGFYSRFGDRGESTRVTWRSGERFDDVVLALPLGCIKPDADGHSPVADWLQHHEPARRCLERLHLVPTVAAQLWLTDEPAQLADRACVTWAQPYSVACDMTPVIAHERWPSPAPASCVYLCGPAPLTAHRAPKHDRQAVRRDRAYAKRALLDQLDAHGSSLFGPSWSLYRAGDERLAAQYVRVNVEPWDLADLPLPGADAVRLEATDSGLTNLALAGAWVRSPMNTTSVEAAVCTGVAAARALGADTQPILGESLLRRPPTEPRLDRPTIAHVPLHTDLRTAS
jgi:uncharacterized protein with NAD-binding domain and iron-sulfur cluster